MEKVDGADSPSDMETTTLIMMSIHPMPIVKPKKMVDQPEKGLGSII